MKLTTYKQEFSKTAETVSRAASKKSDIATLESVMIMAKDNQITLTAYNLTTGIVADVVGRIHEEGSICLNAKMFTDIVKKLPEDIIEIEVDDVRAKIKSGESEYTLSGINADEFPELPEITDDESIALDHELLTNAIKQTIFSVAKVDTGKVIHTGVKFEAHDGLLRLVSTDGFRLSLRETGLNAEVDFVVPAQSLYEVIKMLSQTSENVTICKSSRHISFKSVNYTLISRLLEGEFLNYRSVLDTIPNTRVKVNASALQEALSRVSIIVSDKLASPIKAVFGDNSIHLEATTPLGKAEETIVAKTEGEEITIGFNSGFIGDALKAIGEEDVVITLKDAVSPIILKPTEGEAFKYLVLPVRLKG